MAQEPALPGVVAPPHPAMLKTRQQRQQEDRHRRARACDVIMIVAILVAFIIAVVIAVVAIHDVFDSPHSSDDRAIAIGALVATLLAAFGILGAHSSDFRLRSINRHLAEAHDELRVQHIVLKDTNIMLERTLNDQAKVQGQLRVTLDQLSQNYLQLRHSESRLNQSQHLLHANQDQLSHIQLIVRQNQEQLKYTRFLLRYEAACYLRVKVLVDWLHRKFSAIGNEDEHLATWTALLQVLPPSLDDEREYDVPIADVCGADNWADFVSCACRFRALNRSTPADRAAAQAAHAANPLEADTDDGDSALLGAKAGVGDFTFKGLEKTRPYKLFLARILGAYDPDDFTRCLKLGEEVPFGHLAQHLSRHLPRRIFDKEDDERFQDFESRYVLDGPRDPNQAPTLRELSFQLNAQEQDNRIPQPLLERPPLLVYSEEAVQVDPLRAPRASEPVIGYGQSRRGRPSQQFNIPRNDSDISSIHLRDQSPARDYSPRRDSLALPRNESGSSSTYYRDPSPRRDSYSYANTHDTAARRPSDLLRQNYPGPPRRPSELSVQGPPPMLSRRSSDLAIMRQNNPTMPRRGSDVPAQNGAYDQRRSGRRQHKRQDVPPKDWSGTNSAPTERVIPVVHETEDTGVATAAL
ncbi:uncharacterized protein MONBRDRAFT_33948 [Monosiga brevicollis MX1]|uniref:Uncharacterized protein n=1 Tax=Monosiga brevicollis TaxID=81824 RepID=A9V8P2_MONBE|nr:uncharacterized protein MONBRDRAFT_33948 [Monosiga brevicollis MX1]EDQ86120.1 predicted protein [Monosiga brevicollis MX1]|eukprot:XP_001749045.1 hypothetical protein [Monosiga brevicollis MX1]